MGFLKLLENLPFSLPNKQKKDTEMEEDVERLELDQIDQSNNTIDHIQSWSFEAFLLKTCLNPKLCLRDQLFISFGSVSTGSLFFVVLTAVITVLQAGKEVRGISRGKFEQWAETKLELKSRFLSETIEQKIRNWESLIAIVQETTLDRFRGYPDYPGYQDDSSVPFVDSRTGKHVYPLNGSSSIPIDWQIPQYPDENIEEELTQGGRSHRIKERSSAMTCSIKFQGTCNPDETNDIAPTYQPGCREENNDLKTGGIVAPTDTFHMIHVKSSDYCHAVFRPLWEYHQDVLSINMLFFNSGAGAIVDFPALEVDGKDTYISDGCDWMWQRNPLDATKNIGVDTDISHCHPKGQRVSMREYNPNERGFFASQALDPNEFHIYGPTEKSTEGGQNELMMSGAVYDNFTKSLIGVVQILLDTRKISDTIRELGISESSDVILVRFDKQGTVVASSRLANVSQIVNVTDLAFGIDDEAFTKLKHDFDTILQKDSYDVNEANRVIYREGVYISASLVPVPPKEFESSYKPQFIVLSTTAGNRFLENVVSLEEKVNERVNGIVIKTLIVGLACLAAVMNIVFVVSLFLAKPLEWIKRIGDKLLHDFGTYDLSEMLQYDQSIWVKFAPKTEIKDLALEFKEMVLKFSGEGVAKLWKQSIWEVKNPFSANYFESLYSDRMKPEFKYNYTISHDIVTNLTRSLEKNSSRVNLGSNVHASSNVNTKAGVSISDNSRTRGSNPRPYRSPLFRYIVISITLPLLLGMLTICVLISLELFLFFPELWKEIEETYVDLEKVSLKEFAILRAAYASEVMFASSRNLHLLTRITGWLLSGAITLSQSTTIVAMAAEQCKVFPVGLCDYLKNPQKAVCSCDWNDPRNLTCFQYSEDTRDLQLVFFEGLMEDIYPDGSRNISSYPRLATTPETTYFWPNMSSVQNFTQRNKDSKQAATFDRMRIIAATSMIQIPLHNYGKGSTRFNRHLTSLIAYEADGSSGGYAGCDHSYPDSSKFQSTESNNAAKISEQLCPVGKYGYDARCRGWYATGKEAGLSGRDPLHVTVPYVFAMNQLIGQSVTQSLIDPHSGQLIGQTLIDFTSDRILESLTDSMTPLVDGFHVLITLKTDEKGNDVVVAPGFDFRDVSRTETAAISRYLLPYGSPAGEQRNASLDAILKDMRKGSSGENTFLRYNNAKAIESINFAYAPVSVMSLRTVNSSDLSRGTEIFRPHIFSLALGQKEEGLLALVKGVASKLETSSHIFLTVFSILIAAAILLVVLISYRVTISIITPVAQLLTLTRQMNNLENKNKQSYPLGGPIEVSQVNHMFERLYLLVGFANTAFFSGELCKAIENFIEALELFTKLENSKAIGVTSNNLGNAMFTIYRVMTNTGLPSLCGITKAEAVERGKMYFDNAIRLGEQALTEASEKQGWSNTYLIFLQQLSNRYFNRAVFLLTVKEDLSSPEEAEQQGLTDLETSKDMDREVVDNGDQHGFKGDSDLHFDLLMGRIKGILLLLQLGYEDFWDIDEIFSEAMEEINRAIPNPDDCLFKTLSPAGQMQRLDAALITYFGMEKTKNTLLSAQIAIRMLQDDEYVIRDAALMAVNALIEYTDELTAEKFNGEDILTVQDILFNCRTQLSDDLLTFNDESRDASSIDNMTQGPQSELLMEIF